MKKNVNRSKIDCSPSNYFIIGWGFKETESTTDWTTEKSAIISLILKPTSIE